MVAKFIRVKLHSSLLFPPSITILVAAEAGWMRQGERRSSLRIEEDKAKGAIVVGSLVSHKLGRAARQCRSAEGGRVERHPLGRGST